VNIYLTLAQQDQLQKWAKDNKIRQYKLTIYVNLDSDSNPTITAKSGSKFITLNEE